jgi:hypothetical protein
MNQLGSTIFGRQRRRSDSAICDETAFSVVCAQGLGLGLYIQIAAAAPDGARNDAEAVPPEVESAQRLSHDRIELCDATVRVREGERVRAIAREARRRPAGKRRHDRGGCIRASYRCQEEGGRSETQSRSPTQDDDLIPRLEFIGRIASSDIHNQFRSHNRDAASASEPVLDAEVLRGRVAVSGRGVTSVKRRPECVEGQHNHR